MNQKEVKNEIIKIIENIDNIKLLNFILSFVIGIKK